ncbi:MAG: hypothetical protein KKD63_01870 [Proteobacteria bacterium]|nr:hypothetical protein [Desulfobulbaceae bacterium]MBU4151607.1 hypothetical protein [Pseudomonadota bacterium]MDP2106366.1 hypothetical protein [Desulfobulbaceae bacterium]
MDYRFNPNAELLKTDAKFAPVEKILHYPSNYSAQSAKQADVGNCNYSAALQMREISLRTIARLCEQAYDS